MKHDLTQFGASVLCAIRDRPRKLISGGATTGMTPGSLSTLFFTPLRDINATLRYLQDLSLVDEKFDYTLLDGAYYSITKLGEAALDAYKEERNSKPLPPVI